MFTQTAKTKDEKVEITIASRTVVRILALIFLTVLMWQAFNKATHSLTLIFVAFFLALALNAPVHRLAWLMPGKRRGSRTIGTAVAFLVVIFMLGGFIASVAPPLVRQTNNFIQQAPVLVENVHNEQTTLGKFVRDHGLQTRVDKFAGQLSTRLKDAGGTAFNAVTRISSSIFSVLTVLVLTFMMLIEGPRWLLVAKRLIPPDRVPRAENLAKNMYSVVRGYVNGQVMLALLASLFIAVPIFILGVSYPVALVVIVFVCGLIPLVGHTIGALIVSAVALFHSVPAAIIILAYYFLYQQLENYIVQPRIQANNTNMSPLLVFSSVIIGVSFSGLLGGLVAIPVAGCLKVIVLDYLEHKKTLEPKNATVASK